MYLLYLYVFSQLVLFLGHWGLMYVICKQWRQIVDILYNTAGMKMHFNKLRCISFSST